MIIKISWLKGLKLHQKTFIIVTVIVPNIGVQQMRPSSFFGCCVFLEQLFVYCCSLERTIIVTIREIAMLAVCLSEGSQATLQSRIQYQQGLEHRRSHGRIGI